MRTYTYVEVKSILCEGCRLGVPTTFDMGEMWHTLNGDRVSCLAAEWIKKEYSVPATSLAP